MRVPARIRRLTEPIQEALRRRLQSEPGFAGNLLGEAIESLLRNDVIDALQRLNGLRLQVRAV
jgi:hypothetical protein